MSAGSFRSCWNCGYSVDARALDCIICGKPVHARRIRVIPAGKRRSLLGSAVALTAFGFVALYVYPNVRFSQEELGPRRDSPGVEFVELRESGGVVPAEPVPPAEPWADWCLHGVRFQLPGAGPVWYSGDESNGVAYLPGWRLEYAFRQVDELPRGGRLPVESADALDDLHAFAVDEWDFLADVYSALPDDFHIFYTAGARARLRLRLMLKEAFALPGAQAGIYTYAAGGLRAFLFGRPGVDRVIGLQVPREEGRLDFVVERLDATVAAPDVVRWVHSLADGRSWLADGEVRSTLAARAGGLTIYGALFLLVGLSTSDPSPPPPGAGDLVTRARALLLEEERIETLLTGAAQSIGTEARRRGIADAAGGGDASVDPLLGILTRARCGYRPELGPLAAQSLGLTASLRAVPALAACLDSTDPDLARAVARAVHRLTAGSQTPSPEADLSAWREWWASHRDEFVPAGGR